VARFVVKLQALVRRRAAARERAARAASIWQRQVEHKAATRLQRAYWRHKHPVEAPPVRTKRPKSAPPKLKTFVNSRLPLIAPAIRGAHVAYRPPQSLEELAVAPEAAARPPRPKSAGVLRTQALERGESSSPGLALSSDGAHSHEGEGC